MDEICRVFAGAIHIRLVTAIKLDAEGLNSTEKFLFKVFCVVFVAAERVGNVNVGATDVLVVIRANNRLNVCGDLTATVVLVP